MIREKWKNCSTATEIISLLNNDVSLNKFKVLIHYAFEAKTDIVIDLLKSGLYTPEEIALKPVSVYNRLQYPQIRKVLMEFANKAWMNLDDPSKVLNMRVGLVDTKYKDMIMKLDYFEKRNPEIYKQMLYIIKDTYNINDLKELVFYLTEKSERAYKNKDVLVDLLVEHPSFSSYVRSVAFPDILMAADAKKYKEVVEEDWRNLKNEELIMYRATEENKWDILEYFANNDSVLFKKIVKSYSGKKLSSNHTDKVRYLRNQVIERYENIGLENVPSAIRDYVLELKQSVIDQQKKVEDKKKNNIEERNKKFLSWVDENGDPILFFKVNDFIPKGREDYIKVVDKYLDCSLSVDAFCSKYRISSKDGFIKVLDKISYENEEYARKIDEKAKIKQNKYRALLRKLILSVCEDGESVKNITEYSKLVDCKKILEFANFIDRNKRYDIVLTKKIIDYYYERVNSYNNSYDLDNINKMLSRDEIRFLVGKDRFDSMIKGEKGTVDKAIADLTNNLNNEDRRKYAEKVYGNSDDKLVNALSKYNSKFNSKKYSWDEVFMVNEKGEQIKVTKEIVEFAQRYAFKKGLYTSERVVKTIIRAIVNEKLDANVDLSIEKEKMRNNIEELIKNATSLDEFLLIVDGTIKR